MSIPTEKRQFIHGKIQVTELCFEPWDTTKEFPNKILWCRDEVSQLSPIVHADYNNDPITKEVARSKVQEAFERQWGCTAIHEI